MTVLLKVDSGDETRDGLGGRSVAFNKSSLSEQERLRMMSIRNLRSSKLNFRHVSGSYARDSSLHVRDLCSGCAPRDICLLGLHGLGMNSLSLPEALSFIRDFASGGNCERATLEKIVKISFQPVDFWHNFKPCSSVSIWLTAIPTSSTAYKLRHCLRCRHLSRYERLYSCRRMYSYRGYCMGIDTT